MNNNMEYRLEDILKQLASIEPAQDSLRRMNQNIRSIIAGACRKPPASYGFLYYLVASAAVLLLGIGLFHHLTPVKTQPTTIRQTPAELTHALVKLNAVFQTGGQQALNDYLEQTGSIRQPRAETISLQEIMKEL